MLKELTVRTGRRAEFVDITSKVQSAIAATGVKSGTCLLYVPHTTAGITINEGADPNVAVDIINELEKAAPRNDNYAHLEGNADSHVKTTIAGSSVSGIIADGRFVLGTWQSVFLCEFDGPRSRRVLVKVQPD